MLVGGGSAGHITPLLAVAHKLRAKSSKAEIDYVIEKGSRFEKLPRQAKDIDEVFAIRAGKFRRYHGQSIWAHLVDVKTNLLNIRDLFYFGIGFFQSLKLLGRTRPDAVFIKGGFVGVPVGLACRWRKIPYFTHDSDTIPGLANRLIAKHAVYHAVGMPAEFYNYPKSKTKYTGIPLTPAYKPVSKALMSDYRRKLGLPVDGLVIGVTGGSLGAEGLNKVVSAVAGSLLKSFPELHILHQTGRTDTVYQGLSGDQQQRITEVAFTDDLATFTGASDLVVARAGATTIAELAVQGKACLLVPGAHLTGGQQTKNAEYLDSHQAAVMFDETVAEDATKFETAISELLRDAPRRELLAKNLAKMSKPDAAEALADIMLDIAEHAK